MRRNRSQFFLYSRLNMLNMSDALPRLVWLTWREKALIPQKVRRDLQRFAKGYDVRIFEDSECEPFVQKHCGEEAAGRYRALQTPAHRADLWRYCALWSQGGIYLDIKTWLVQPLSTIFAMNNTGYTVLAAPPLTKCIYQGIMAAPPKDPTLYRLLMLMVRERTAAELNAGYSIPMMDAYDTLTLAVGEKLRSGKRLTTLAGRRWILFHESERTFCTPRDKDKYGKCFHIRSAVNGRVVFRTRHPDFPASFLSQNYRRSHDASKHFRCQTDMRSDGPCLQGTPCPLRVMTLGHCQKRCLADSRCVSLVYNVYESCYLKGQAGKTILDSPAHGTHLCVNVSRNTK